MKKSKYLLLGVVLSSVIFTACGSDLAGVTSGQIDDSISSNYLLKNISLDAPSLYDENDPNATKLPLNYSFNPSAWTYRVDVPNSIDVITITAEKEHHWAAVYLGSVAPGNELTDRDPSGPVSLSVGENIIKIIVVAEDGQLNEYTVTVTRHTVEHADATLSVFNVGGVTGLSPEFTVGTTARTFSANTGNSSLSVDAVAASAGSGATVEYRSNNDEVADQANIPLNEGMNVIQVVCTAGDGATTETYTLNVNRQVASTSVDLAALAIDGATFDAPFDKDTTFYNVNLSSSMSPINLTAQAESYTATVEVTANGTSVDPASIALVEGYNTIVVTVTNAGSSKQYTIIANVTTASSNANLRSLKAGVGTISTRPIHPGTFVRGASYHNPASVAFSKTQYDYVTVIYGFSTMKITAVADDSSAMDVQFAVASSGPGAHGSVASQSYTGGTATATINLVAGRVSQVDITVTAASGTTQVYRLYAKLLNVDEFYWGIYGPSMDASKNRWTKPQPGTYNGTGIVSGTVNWVVTTEPVSTITLTNYNDGDLGFLYNNGGINVQGAHRAVLASITNKDGWDLTHNPPFLIRTASAETVAELDYHLWIDDGDPVERRGATLPETSYTGIKYLGATTWHIQYFATTKPYPFTSSYDWFTPWSDGQ
jgi:hypothetical protein